MTKRKNTEQNVFSLSFIDVFANTLGGLAFILILVILMIGLKFGIPIINTNQLPDAYTNTPYEIWLSASDGGGLYNWQIVEGELPPGMELEDPYTGRIAGTPTISDRKKNQESYSFTVLVNSGDTASDKTDTQTYELTVFSNPFGEVKILTETDLPKALKQSEYPLVLSAQGGKLPYNWSIINTNLNGISINDQGKILGAPTNDEGVYDLEVSVNDQYGNSDRKKLEVEVVEIPDVPPPPPVISIRTDSLPSAITGKKYKLALAAEGGRAPYQWSGTINNDNLEITEDGHFSGIPEKTGEYTVNLQVRDNEGGLDNKNGLRFTVLPAPREKIDPLDILHSDPLPEAFINTEYSIYLSAAGGIPPYNWTLEPDANNAGIIELSSNGQLSMNFVRLGNYNFTVHLQDDLENESTESYSIKVNPAIPELEIEMDGLPNAVKGFQYSSQLNAVGGYGPYEWSLPEDADLPGGLMLADSKISGIPGEPWQGNLNIQVLDRTGQMKSKNIYLEVLESGQGSITRELEILTDTFPDLLTGKDYKIFIATHGGADPKSWEIEGVLPRGLVFQNGELCGKSRSKGLFKFTIRVSDPTGQTTHKDYILNVRTVVNAFWKLVALAMCLATVLLMVVLIRLRKSKKMVLKILTSSIPNARCSFPYKVHLAAMGGVPPYKWSISGGQLPSGVELTPEGILEGEPLKGVKLEEIKEIKFEVQVKDSFGNSAKQEL